ncbi:hypothetical protein H8L32_10930 [Undibacterium sp. CY18W]|uniref:Nucleotidyl transferase domain-containing protein n=1 Tax=Undibacterium hunanense TaxID=2762292 RepID=A0ABR6ZQ35_9BURK|nr:sugar phosphate nucleotidyltransferase [Undibacterium hunanense]MBC3917990.1 hypothetical protein [Undibacterium hunanense]
MNKSINEFAGIPVVILCGGKGVLLDDQQTVRLNKGLVNIKGKPLFWWVMLHYALHGASDFILAAGVQYEQFSQFLKNSEATQEIEDRFCYELKIGKNICRVRIVVTAPDDTTAARLLACQSFLKQKQQFALTYSDTLSDVDLTEEIRLHKRQNLVATMVATKLPVRFRILGIRTGETLVRAFASRPVIEAANINGGYYIFSHRIWEAGFGLSDQLALENQPLDLLAAAGQLNSFAHNGGWQTCDAERDITELSRLASYLETAAQASD